MEIKRKSGRNWDEMREIKIYKNFLKYGLGSCLIELGDTKVLCAVNIEEKVPSFLKDTQTGWITAEYSMLPSSSEERVPRSSNLTGRSQEIRRIIGRCLRSIFDLRKLGERTLIFDCDVIQADGGTRIASVIGSFVSLVLAIDKMRKNRLITIPVIKDYLAGISTGIVRGNLLLDLDYSEDSVAEVDMNIFMTGKGEIVEIQGTGEGRPFSKKELFELLTLAEKGISRIIEVEKEILKNEIEGLLGH